MPEAPTLLRNNDPLVAFLLALAALAANAGFLVSNAVQVALPWLSLALAIISLIFIARGLRRSIVHSQLYRGKVLSVVLSVLTLAVAGFSIVAFFGARKLPSASAAPQVGEKVPDFVLSDTAGQPVSLEKLFISADSSSPAPKAVLLIFYRGYW
jgi:hypothetical protein